MKSRIESLSVAIHFSFLGSDDEAVAVFCAIN